MLQMLVLGAFISLSHPYDHSLYLKNVCRLLNLPLESLHLLVPTLESKNVSANFLLSSVQYLDSFSDNSSM